MCDYRGMEFELLENEISDFVYNIKQKADNSLFDKFMAI